MHPDRTLTRRRTRRASTPRAAFAPFAVLALSILIASMAGCNEKDLTGTDSPPPGWTRSAAGLPASIGEPPRGASRAGSADYAS